MTDLQTRQKWLETRRRGLGSTDAAAILNRSPWKTPLHVYLDKVGEIEDSDSAPKRWGRMLEEVIAIAYEEEEQVRVVPPYERVSQHRQYPQLLASLDRLALHQDGTRILECKSSEEAGGWGQERTDEIPEHYLIQVQHQMMVTEYAQADVAVLIGGNRFRVYHVQRSERFIKHLMEIELDFWQMVEGRSPPAIDWSHPRTIDLVKNMYEVDDKLTVNLDGSAESLVREYLLSNQQASFAEKKKERIKAELLVLMKSASEAIVPDGTRLLRKTVNRAGFAVKPTSFVRFQTRPSEAMKADVSAET